MRVHFLQHKTGSGQATLTTISRRSLLAEIHNNEWMSMKRNRRASWETFLSTYFKITTGEACSDGYWQLTQ